MSLTSPSPASTLGVYCTSVISHIEEHINWMVRCDRAESTIKARRMVLTWLAEFLGNDPAWASEDDLDRWQSSIPNPSYIRWQTLMVRPYYRWLQAKGYRSDNPAALLPLPKARRGLPRPIADEQLFAAVASAPPRVLPWLLLAGWCGLRAGEIATLTVDAFSRGNDGIMWARVKGKGQVVRDVPVPGWIWAVIEVNLPAEGRCFRRAYRPLDKPLTAKLVSKACNSHLESQGVPDRLHSLRHRVATSTLEETRDHRMVQDLLGHGDLGTLAVYTRIKPARMAAALEALPRPVALPTAGPPITRLAG